jgi:hypothetical protein
MHCPVGVTDVFEAKSVCVSHVSVIFLYSDDKLEQSMFSKEGVLLRGNR